MLFIVFFVPESMPSKKVKKGAVEALTVEPFNWQHVDPFLSLKVIAKDVTVLQLATVVFLSK